MKNFLLNAEDKLFREDARRLLAAELLPRAGAIEEREDWDSVKAAVQKVGQAGYLKLMFADLYSGPLTNPGLTHATILSEEAAAINYAFDTTIGTALSCAYPLHRHATARVREQYLHGIVEGLEVGAIGVTEACVGSDSAGMQTRIEFDDIPLDYPSR